MSQFSIGEIAIFVKPRSTHYGTEVTILSELRPCKETLDPTTKKRIYYPGQVLVYEIGGITDYDGYVVTSIPEWLRKKRPPSREMDTKVSWDDCLWKPQHLTDPIKELENMIQNLRKERNGL